MVVHSGELYWGKRLVIQVTPMIGYLYTLFTLQRMHVHTDVHIK